MEDVQHPEHDRLVVTVRSWYTTSEPAMGYQIVPGRFGLHGANTRAPGVTPWLVLGDLTPPDVPALLIDLRGRYGEGTVRLLIDDRRVDAEVGPALLSAGCRQDSAQTYLAHVGPVPAAATGPGLEVETVGEQNLPAFVATKLKAFASSEVEPAAADVRAGLALRRAELAGAGRFFLARLDGEPAAILGLYDGVDRLIFNLATRVPFRGRGIAKYLLGRALSDAYSQGCRSVIINADPDDTPVRLYRRLGFADEVYWRRQYTVSLPLRR